MNKYRLLTVMDTSLGKVAVFDVEYRVPSKNDIVRIDGADFRVIQPLEVSGSNSINRVALLIRQI